jgi:hypothetical protein
MSSKLPIPDNEEELISRWEQRQNQLASVLEACGATPTAREIDWEKGRVTWVDSRGQPLAAADMKALCSYSYEDNVLMMAWARGQHAGAVVPPLQDVPAELPGSNEAAAWLWAMTLAQENDADYLLRVAAPSYLVFLGLWNLIPALSDSHIEKGSAEAFVLSVLDRLRQEIAEKQQDPAALRRSILNHGESLLQSRHVLASDARTEELLTRSGRTLIELAASFGHRRFGLLPPNPLTAEALLLLNSKLDSLRASWLSATSGNK